jgi:hypothetical protein
MLNFDPNHPPERLAKVRLARWEYSDPVGVPHPDAVTLVVEASPETAGDIGVRLQWRIRGRWVSVAAPGVPVESHGPAGERVLRLDIRVKEKIEDDHAARLRASIVVAGKVVVRADLPIQAGD